MEGLSTTPAREASPPKAVDAAKAEWALLRASSGLRVNWIHLLLIAIGLGALFRMNLQRLWVLTNPSSGDANWGHAIFIPLVSLAYLLEHRERIRRTPLRSTPVGFAFMLGGMALFVYGIGMGSSFAQFSAYVQDVGMLVTLFGAVLAVFGWKMVGVAMFPMAYLLCALPWPPYVHDLLTVPLQKVAATTSVIVLRLTGLNVDQAGNTIHILSSTGADRALNVADACSGMRSLITFIAVGLGVAFLSFRPLWQKLIISASAVPIAIACNVFRISGEALIDHYISRSLSEGFAHAAVGVVLLVPGFGLFLLVGWVLDRVFVVGKGSGVRGQGSGVRGQGTGNRIKRAAGTVSPSPGTPGESFQSSTGRGGKIGSDHGESSRISKVIYVGVVALLFSAAGALAVSSEVLKLHFKKVSVALVKPLSDVPADLGPWRQCGGNHAVADDVRDVLGTSQYIFRDYVDERVMGHDVVESIRQDPVSADSVQSTIAPTRPRAVVRLGVTYYTGRVDAVIHQSERCNVAGGAATSVESVQTVWTVNGQPLRVRRVRLIKQTPEQTSSHYVAYCYLVNGQEESEAWRVRGMLMNIFEPAAWYAKVEVMTNLSDEHAAERVLTEFLNTALPEIEKCLPPMAGDAQLKELK